MGSSRAHVWLMVAIAATACISGGSCARQLLSVSPPNSDIINSILSKGVKVFTFGQNTQIPPPTLQGAVDLASFGTPFQPSQKYSTESASTILFACRAVGNQIYTASKYTYTRLSLQSTTCSYAVSSAANCPFLTLRLCLTDATNPSQYVNSAAHADLWCGPGAAKIAIKHFFANTSTQTEVSDHMHACNTMGPHRLRFKAARSQA